MDKIYFEELNIEVTRKCNMDCAHCLNGEHENIDANIDYIKEILKHTAFIGTIGFSGGEPSLNPKAMLKTLEIVKEYNIPVLNTDIVTNGKLVMDDFIIALKEWHKYCSLYNLGQQENCHITKDMFHEQVNPNNIKKLTDLGFVGIKSDNFKTDGKVIILLGKGRNLKGLKGYNIGETSLLPYTIYKYNNNFYVTNSQIKLTCKGNICRQCDYEFINEKNVIICNYKDILKAFNKESKIPNKNTCFFYPFKNGLQP